MEIAAQMAGGYEVVAFCEREPYAQSVLRKRFPGVRIYNDVNDISRQKLRTDGIDSIDVITAGFPCQPFSVAGKRAGQDDERHLWPIIRNIISDIRPRYAILENVPGILSIPSMDGTAGGVFGQILCDLAEIRYCCAWFCYGAADVGAPHRRDRVFIVAYAGL
jgi:DNA (cytosine-5)-methyltransferase 1